MADPVDTSLGAYIRRQRELHELSMRQVAEMAGISNPYLSQIEHGLREPSEKVLEAIARSLQLSADKLYEESGRARPAETRPDGEEPPVVTAIREDPDLSAQERKALLGVYQAFVGRRRAPRAP